MSKPLKDVIVFDTDESDLIESNPENVYPEDPLSGFSVDYLEAECGFPCTPDGCLGHATDIPISFSVGGITFFVDGEHSGDFPRSTAEAAQARKVVNALRDALKSARLK